jgi:CDP-glucose 4,6-dehydratase
MNKLEIYKHKKVLITGHTGFKGSWLSIWLNKIGAEVIGISSDVPSSPSHFEAANIKNLVHDHRIDICDLKSISKLVKKEQPDFIFHLAAQSLVKKSYTNPIDTIMTNVLGTSNILEAARKINKACAVVLITSDKCYDNVEWEWGYRETDKLGGPDPYSGSKGAAELIINCYINSFFNNSEIRIGVGRAGNVIGGGDWAADRIVPDCIRACSGGGQVSLRNPNATRPWQHVLEPLGGYLTLGVNLYQNNSLHGEAFNFGPSSNNNYSVGDLVKEMMRHWDVIKFEDKSASYDGPYESGLLKLNCDKALYHLDWKPTWDFETTVEKTILWYKYNYDQDKILDYSSKQIDEYVCFAEASGASWT